MSGKFLKTLSGRKASQHPDELARLIGFCREHGVRRYLEIGARHGDTFFEIAKSMPKGSLAVAVDLPGGPWGKSSSHPSLMQAASELVGHGITAKVIIGDSTSQAVIEKILHFKHFDLIMIDGDHRYEGVRLDWENYRDIGSHIAFHDIVGDGLRDKKTGFQVDVPRLWCEIRADHRHVEFIHHGSQMGIGVVSV